MENEILELVMKIDVREIAEIRESILISNVEESKKKRALKFLENATTLFFESDVMSE